MCKNMTYTLWKVDVPPNMCRGTFVAINKLITKMYKHNIKTDDDIYANLFAEFINIHYDTCDTSDQCDANDIVMYLTTM